MQGILDDIGTDGFPDRYEIWWSLDGNVFMPHVDHNDNGYASACGHDTTSPAVKKIITNLGASFDRNKIHNYDTLVRTRYIEIRNAEDTAFPGSSGFRMELYTDTPLAEQVCEDALLTDYRGNQVKTKNGRDCQPWTSQSPNRHGFTAEFFPDTGLTDGEEQNKCRNPSRLPSGPWCLTKQKVLPPEKCPKVDGTLFVCDDSLEWESCGITTATNGGSKLDDDVCLPRCPYMANITRSAGTLSTPWGYSENSYCQWLITPSDSYAESITLKFKDSLELKAGDSLKIYAADSPVPSRLVTTLAQRQHAPQCPCRCLRPRCATRAAHQDGQHRHRIPCGFCSVARSRPWTAVVSHAEAH